MGCLLALVAMLSPRLALFLVWLFTERFTIAFDGWLLPIVGFLFLPWTTLAWTVAYQPIGGVTGFGWFVVVLAFVVDLAAYGSSERARRRRGATI
jgi:hypothetical protein